MQIEEVGGSPLRFSSQHLESFDAIFSSFGEILGVKLCSAVPLVFSCEVDIPLCLSLSLVML